MKKKLKKIVALMLVSLTAIMCMPQTAKASEGYSIRLVQPEVSSRPYFSIYTPEGVTASEGWYLVNDVWYYQEFYSLGKPNRVATNTWIDNKYYVDFYGAWCSDIPYEANSDANKAILQDYINVGGLKYFSDLTRDFIVNIVTQ